MALLPENNATDYNDMNKYNLFAKGKTYMAHYTHY